MKNCAARTAPNPDFFSTQILQARRFFLNLNPQTRNHLTVACGGMECCDRNYDIQRSTFPFYSIEFVAHGLGSLRLGTKEHRLNAGTVFSYGPGVPHEISTDPQQPLIKYFVDFAGSGASALLKSSGLRGKGNFNVAYDGDILLQAGQHAIRVEYINDFMPAKLQVEWQGPRWARTEIGKDSLWREP